MNDERGTMNGKKKLSLHLIVHRYAFIVYLMPELPEVEIRLLYFRRAALGQCVERAIITAPGMIKSSSARSFASNRRGRGFVDAHRRGKYLIITLDDNRLLILHFGMGGDLCLYESIDE